MDEMVYAGNLFLSVVPDAWPYCRLQPSAIKWEEELGYRFDGRSTSTW